MKSATRIWGIAFTLIACCPGLLYAGMPSFTLSDVGRMRLQTISFFLFGFFGSALLIQWLWNYLRSDFAFLPRLTYGKALGVVSLWGLLFVLVLTMISGARELMTPGAWEKNGLTYKLATDFKQAADSATKNGDPKRRAKLEDLRQTLWQYADTHHGQFPPDKRSTEIPKENWQTTDPSGISYIYMPGRTVGTVQILAFEPELFGTARWVLFASAEIRQMTSEEISRQLSQRLP
jgi:hypothetical protein